jgi:L-rhamnose mutarotase
MANEQIVAFRMQLKPGNVAEYKRRHDEIWPELSQLLREATITEYYIFLDEATLALFAFQKVIDPSLTAKLPALPIMRRWWDYMADLMETNPDHSPVAILCPEVFRL